MEKLKASCHIKCYVHDYGKLEATNCFSTISKIEILLHKELFPSWTIMNIWTFLVASYGGIQCVAYITYITRLLDWNADTFAITSLYSGLSDYLHILSMPVCWCVLLASVILPYSTITLGGLTVFFIKISYTTARITTQKRENWNLKECQITPKIFEIKIS